MRRKRTKTELMKAGGPERVRQVLEATGNNQSEAARLLGVDRSTLHRWAKEFPEIRKALDQRQAATDEAIEAAMADGVAGPLTPDQWKAAIERAYVLSATERVTLELARETLLIAFDPDARPSDRLAAMGRFRALVKDLNLEAPPKGGVINGEVETSAAAGGSAYSVQ